MRDGETGSPRSRKVTDSGGVGQQSAVRRQPSAAVLPRAERGIVDGPAMESLVFQENAWTKSRQVGKGDRGPASFPAGFGFNEPSAFGRKVGRNETCPCGSGQKYKTCCGAD